MPGPSGAGHPAAALPAGGLSIEYPSCPPGRGFVPTEKVARLLCGDRRRFQTTFNWWIKQNLPFVMRPSQSANAPA
jgi:hypothetical protein